MKQPSVGVVVLGALSAACCAASAARAQVQVQVIDNFFRTSTAGNPGFNTPITTINLGDTVEWIFVGPRQHTVTSAMMGLFDSGVRNAGTSFSFTFTSLGEFDYYCQLHGSHDHASGQVSGMSGRIIVIPAPGAGAVASGLFVALRRRRTL